jgi:hypothetical protein
VLRLHEVIATVDSATALSVGLMVDVDALPRSIIAALRAGQVDLTDPAVTIELLRLNAVVGVKGTVSKQGQLASLGITCASATRPSTTPSARVSAGGWMDGRISI